MYAVINQNNEITDFETRGLALEESVVAEFRGLYLPIVENHGLKLGDIWHEDTQTWEIVPSVGPPVIPEPEVVITIANVMAELEAMKVGMKATGVLPKDFVQPTGAHDAYTKGTKVVYQGQIWESTIDANVWSPTDYPQGWKIV